MASGVDYYEEAKFAFLECLYIAIIHHRSPQDSIIKLDWCGRDRSPGRTQEEDTNSRTHFDSSLRFSKMADSK